MPDFVCIRQKEMNLSVECKVEITEGEAQTKLLSTELAGNFTGVVIGLYAQKYGG